MQECKILHSFFVRKSVRLKLKCATCANWTSNSLVTGLPLTSWVGYPTQEILEPKTEACRPVEMATPWHAAFQRRYIINKSYSWCNQNRALQWSETWKDVKFISQLDTPGTHGHSGIAHWSHMVTAIYCLGLAGCVLGPRTYPAKTTIITGSSAFAPTCTHRLVDWTVLK